MKNNQLKPPTSQELKDIKNNGLFLVVIGVILIIIGIVQINVVAIDIHIILWFIEFICFGGWIPIILGICFIGMSLENFFAPEEIYYRDEKAKEDRRIFISLNQANNDKFKVEEELRFLLLDNTNKLMKLTDKEIEVFEFTDLKEFKVYQDNNQVVSGKTGVALDIGGIIVGGSSSSNIKNVIKKVDFVLFFEGINEGRYTCNLYTGNLDTNTEEYRLISEDIERISRKLTIIIEENKVL